MAKRVVPDWAIQTSWSISGIFATGAVWYFLSIGNVLFTVIAAICAAIFAIFAIVLHRKKDSSLLTKEELSTSETNAAIEFARRYSDEPSHIRFIKSLPKLKAIVFENAHEGWDTGVTADMQQANYDVIDFLEYVWLRLAEFYPPSHFDQKDSRSYIRDYIRDRFTYHWAKHEPNGPGTGGTIVGVLTGGDVINDLESMIADTISALFRYHEAFNYDQWLKEWQQISDRNPATSR